MFAGGLMLKTKTGADRIERKFLLKKSMPLPNLIEIQLKSYHWFIKEGLKELFEEVFPVIDFTGEKMELRFVDYSFDQPKYDEVFARENYLTFKAPLKVKLSLVNKDTGEIKEQEVFLGDFPQMTDQGTFIINGIERIVVNQIVRSYGVLFVADEVAGRQLFGAKIIPQRGAWLEFETNIKDIISVRIDRRRRIPVTTFLRALGYGTDEDLTEIFSEKDDKNQGAKLLKATLEKDPASNHREGVLETYKRIRPGEMASYENAKSLINSMFFDLRRYDLSKVGRYKINQRLNQNIPLTLKNRVLRKEDVAEVIKEIIRLDVTPGSEADDIDHLSNRRIRSVGELIQDRTRVGLMRLERIIKDRMSVVDPNIATPAMLINARPIIAVLQEFFASSQLSQFMNQTNPLAELEHKRCLSAIGPGGLSRERAGFEARDVHSSHYGRICPIETPEGPNIGLVGYLASYAKVNDFGFIETPYKKVIKELPISSNQILNRMLGEKITDKDNQVIADKNQIITKALLVKIGKVKNKVKVRPFISNSVIYLNAIEEEQHIIAPSPYSEGELIDEKNQIIVPRMVVRKFGKPDVEAIEKIDLIGVSPEQIVSISAALIPFLEHTDGVRASMGANMERQSVPLISSHSPIVGTGLEAVTARDSGQLVVCQKDGEVVEVDASHIKVKSGKEDKAYHLINFSRSNQGTCLHQKPLVWVGEKVKQGDILADSLATEKGELALGRNTLVAFMSWEGFNFEDAIIVSSRLVEEDAYSSIHIERYAIEIRDTKLGPEVITRDIPNVAEETLRNLDQSGVVRIGAEVKEGDILVGKITPKGETELSAEERLLRAIFGEKAKDVRDTSLRLPHGERGRVVDVKIFSKEKGAELPAGVFQMIEVSVAQLRKVSVGDKLAGRYGNKGVIARILPKEDMPFLPDGTPIDIVLNPLGVISRMNIGQIFETHLGWALTKLGYKIANPVFQCVGHDYIRQELKRAGLPEDGKTILHDGRTGEAFNRKVMVGSIYIMKLIHLVDDKIHARSVGPYSMVTQQPLGGKAQFGGQRFGEMEVWALEAYGAAYTLQEMLTIKSDDVSGRSKAYEAIIKGEPITQISTPESFNVLVKELQSLGLSVDLLKNGQPIKMPNKE